MTVSSLPINSLTELTSVQAIRARLTSVHQTQDTLERQLQSIIDGIDDEGNGVDRPIKIGDSVHRQKGKGENPVKTLLPTLLQAHDNPHDSAQALLELLDATWDSAQALSERIRTLDTTQKRSQECLNLVQSIQHVLSLAQTLPPALDLALKPGQATGSSDLVTPSTSVVLGPEWNEVCRQLATYYKLDLPPIHAILEGDDGFYFNEQSSSSHSNQGRDEDEFMSLPKTPSPIAVIESCRTSVKDFLIAQFQRLLRLPATASDRSIAVATMLEIFKALSVIDYAEIATQLHSNLLAQIHIQELNMALVAATQPPVSHTERLSRLLEQTANVIHAHLPIYLDVAGVKHASEFIRRIVREVNIHGNGALDAFQSQHGIDALLKSVLGVGKGSARQSGNDSSSSINNPTSGVDLKQLDGLITEISEISRNTELFELFLQRCQETLEAAEHEGLSRGTHGGEDSAPIDSPHTKLSILRSRLNERIQSFISHCVSFEIYFIKASIAKAMALDPLGLYAAADTTTASSLPNAGTGQMVSNSIDDVFFILNHSIRRAIHSMDIHYLCALVNSLGPICEEEVMGVYARFMQFDPSKDHSRALTLFNNMHVCCTYIDKLAMEVEKTGISSLSAGSASRDVTLPAAKLEQQLKSCLGSFREYTVTFTHAIREHMEALVSILRPKVKPMLVTAYGKDYSYVMDEPGYESMNGVFAQRFLLALAGLTSKYQTALSEPNYSLFMLLFSDAVALEWERVILTTPHRFTAYGALAFDADVRAVSAHFLAPSAYKSKEKFSRLVQMSTILGSESVLEIYDFWENVSTPGHAWKLTGSQAKKILSLRVDYKAEDIKALNL